MIEISINLMLLKQATAENIIDIFERVRRQNTNTMEIVINFKLLFKVQKNGIAGEDYLYRNINLKSKEWIK